MTVTPSPATLPVPGLRVIPGLRQSRPRLFPWIAYTFLVIVAFYGLIYAQTAVNQGAFELDRVQDQIQVEQIRFEGLRLETARLSSPERVAPLAESLGMVLPAQLTTLTTDGLLVLQGEDEDRWAEMKSILTASP